MIAATRSAQRKVARVLAALAALVVVACVAVLVTDLIDARRSAPLDRQRLAQLRERVKTDASVAAQLDAEYDRQAAASLRRAARARLLAWVLLSAGAALLAGVKWLLSLQGRRAPALGTIVALRQPPARKPESAASGARARRGAAVSSADGIDLAFVDTLVARTGRTSEAAVPLLRAIQAHYGYLPNEALARVCALTEIAPAQIAGVSTFYARFRRSPVGQHVVKVCHGTACHVAGARQITAEIRRHLRIGPAADTDPERVFTVDRVACLGCCSLAPVMMIDDETVGRLTPSRACAALDALRLEVVV